MKEETGPVRQRVAKPDADEDVVAFLRKAWVAPTPSALREPCSSGLDRIVIDDPAFRSFGG
jgi:hypothetical protein